MVSWSILLEHGWALALVWAWVALAGFALLPILRLQIGLVGMPLVGVVYWTLALYVLPFAGGLDLAAALIAVLALIAGVRGGWWPVWKRWSWSTSILLLGSLPFTTTLLFHYVPFGMDGSMHTTAAALIARSGGMPHSYAPYAPDMAFLPMNLGLPTVAGQAIRWGGEPAAVMLACHHLTFTALILATYLLLRWWIAPPPAALLAVASVWMARATQASLEWGGFPTVLSVTIGIFAIRLILQQMRSVNWRTSIAAGAAIAATPLIHGVGAGTWLYCAGPWIALAALMQARGKLATLRGLALSGVAAAAFLLVYRSAGTIDVNAQDLNATHDWQRESAPLHGNIWLASFEFIRKDSGSLIVVAGWVACGLLAIRRQWLAAGLLACAWLALAVVVANSRWWVLPGSFLLYPERAIYWAAPLSAVGLALAWRVLTSPKRKRGTRRTPSLTLRASMIAASIGLIGVAGYFQNQFYQKIVREDFVNADGWEALVWARQHLQPDRDFVQTKYGATGSFLPAIAQIGCNGAHHHHFLQREVMAMYQRHKPTHVLVDHALAPKEDVPTGAVVFRNRTITIVDIRPSVIISRGS